MGAMHLSILQVDGVQSNDVLYGGSAAFNEEVCDYLANILQV